jgi:hypothetical protein
LTLTTWEFDFEACLFVYLKMRGKFERHSDVLNLINIDDYFFAVCQYKLDDIWKTFE